MNKGAFLTASNVRQIKALLWKGEMRQRDIADHYYITQATVSGIYRGHVWPQVKWPNGKAGGIPEDHRKVQRLLKTKRGAIPATSAQVTAIAAEVEKQLGAKQQTTDFGSVITGKKRPKTKKG